MKWRKVLALALSTAMIAGVCPISAAELEVTEEVIAEAVPEIEESYEVVENVGGAEESSGAIDLGSIEEATPITEEETVLPEEVGIIEESELVEEELFEEADAEELVPSDEELLVETESDIPPAGQDEGVAGVEEQTETEELALVGADDDDQDQKLFVLMNIPYDKFYEAEGVSGVDAVTSATLNKPRTGTLAGGSYHVNSDGTDITGVIYPVLVEDAELLKGFTEITDESSVDITVTNRGQTTTTTYSSQDALFEAPSYAYYTLNIVPAYYKVLNADGSFSAVNGSATTVEGVTGEVTVGARHADIEIKLTGTEGIDNSTKVSGIVLTDADGNKYALRHIANIWRGIEIGWDNDEFALFGKTLTNIRYYTQESVIDFPVNIIVRKLFDDVTDPEEFYFEPVYWAVDNNITTGWEDNSFRPLNEVNRAAVVTFLWRMAGKPEPTKAASFKDMTGNEEFDKAISWAAEKGITTGWKDNTFRPWDTCKRAAIVTFIWRYAGKPAAGAAASFTDMTGNEEFDKAISWAAEKGITTGYEEDNTFRPYITCKRLAIVSFLQRYASGLEG